MIYIIDTITYAEKELKTKKNMFPSCETYKPTRAHRLASRMSNIANEVKVSHREPLGHMTIIIDFHTESHQNHITISSHIYKVSPSWFSMLLTKQL